MKPMSFAYWRNTGGTYRGHISGSDPARARTMTGIFSDGSNRVAGDPCCFLGCNEVKAVFKYLKAWRPSQFFVAPDTMERLYRVADSVCLTELPDG